MDPKIKGELLNHAFTKFCSHPGSGCQKNFTCLDDWAILLFISCNKHQFFFGDDLRKSIRSTFKKL